MGSKRREVRHCSVDGCEGRHYGKGFCSLHYDRVKRTGSPHLPEKLAQCVEDGCDLPPRTRGMCRRHYLRWYRDNAPKPCSIKGCGGRAAAREMCNTHYARWRRTGDPGPADLMKEFRDPSAREKECSTCGVVKEVGEFYRDPRYPDRAVARCKACTIERQRTGAIKYRYGVDADEYEEMVTAQSGRCATCSNEVDLCVDHDHKTGAVRQLLCRRCNVTLGQVDDDPELLQSLIDYLSRHRPE